MKNIITLKEAMDVAESEIERLQKNRNICKGNIKCLEGMFQEIKFKNDVFRPWRYVLVFRIKKGIYYEVIINLKGAVLSLKRKFKYKKLI